MTDEEDIMKELRKVANRDCNFCWQKGENCDGDECEKVIAEKILNTYNQQKAEIERLTRLLAQWKKVAYKYIDSIENIKSEAIKEFAAKLKCGVSITSGVITCADIDDLLAEMVGGENA